MPRATAAILYGRPSVFGAGEKRVAVLPVEYVLHSVDACWNAEKWRQLPDDGTRYEVVAGVLYRSTVRTFAHQRVVWNLVSAVGIPFRGDRHGTGVIGPIGVYITPDEPVQPDFLLIRQDHTPIVDPHGHMHGVPDLIAEVLSPGFPELDTVIKRAAYARAGVPEYWLVRPACRDILVLTGPDATLKHYTDIRRFGRGEDVISPTLPIRVPVDALFEDTIGESSGL
jgi:Uma2 family endonuclease